jgi:hypothetical protein
MACNSGAAPGVQTRRSSANLKERRRDTYERLVSEWNTWNATILPGTASSSAENIAGAEMADHFGMKRVPLDPDPELK